MANGKSGSRIKAVNEGSVPIGGIPHEIVSIFGNRLYILRPVQARGKGHNINRIRYPSWEALKRDYPEAARS